jgi:DNA-binding NarL/FixJ family response regulator
MAFMFTTLFISITSSKMAALLNKSTGMHNALNKNTFTETEIKFTKLACTDMTYKEIAAQMHLSASSIDNFRHLLFEKTGVSSRVGLAVYAIKNGIASF